VKREDKSKSARKTFLPMVLRKMEPLHIKRKDKKEKEKE